MAVADDLNRLVAQDIVYLSRSFNAVGVNAASGASGAKEVFRGRLRQALNGNWIFNAFTGQNGVVGFNLGQLQPNWGSFESPGSGIQVNIANPALNEIITLTTLIPSDFSE